MELTQHISDSLLSRKLLLVTICIALAATVSRAQPLVVTGTISTTSGESLAFASVLLLTPGDSTIVHDKLRRGCRSAPLPRQKPGFC